MQLRMLISTSVYSHCTHECTALMLFHATDWGGEGEDCQANSAMGRTHCYVSFSFSSEVLVQCRSSVLLNIIEMLCVRLAQCVFVTLWVVQYILSSIPLSPLLPLSSSPPSPPSPVLPPLRTSFSGYITVS